MSGILWHEPHQQILAMHVSGMDACMLLVVSNTNLLMHSYVLPSVTTLSNRQANSRRD